MIIQDGTGSGCEARVNQNKQLATFSVTESEAIFTTDTGNSFNINTGDITLTSSNPSAIMYIKNSEEQPLIVEFLAYAQSVGSATVTDLAKLEVIRNPTQGTIVSNAIEVDQNENRNFSSSNTLSCDAYKGAEGDTFTDGNTIAQLYQGNGRLFANIGFELGKGDSLGLKVTPYVSAGSIKTYAAISCFIKDSNLR